MCSDLIGTQNAQPVTETSYSVCVWGVVEDLSDCSDFWYMTPYNMVCSRYAQIPGAMLPGQLNFVRWRLTGPQAGSCFMSSF
jgi:hypothetical protein